MKYCILCGNEIDEMCIECPYCHSKKNKINNSKKSKVETYDLEKGMPPTHQALDELEIAIKKHINSNVNLIRVIHGWGSSGKGGKIREAVIKRLRSKKRNGTIKYYLNGEMFSKYMDDTQNLLMLYPKLRSFLETDSNNKGITFIFL